MTTVNRTMVEILGRDSTAAAFRSVNSGLSNLQTSAKKVLGVISALGVTLSAAAFAGFIRGAIDAADGMSKLSQKIGVTVSDVAGLQLAFRQSGLGADTLRTSIAMLSRRVAEGHKAFDAMGVATRNTDGTLKTTRQLLGEVADKFAAYEDGAAKTALAMELFGRSGADLIPLLNGGSSALDDFDAMARKLGLTLDAETAKQAEKFNDTLDLMGQGMQGIGRQIAAEMLPTLTGLAEHLFTTTTEGDRLKSIADSLSTALKGLTATAIGIVGAFQAAGTAIGGAAAVIVSVFQGDFDAARVIANQIKSDLSTGFKSTLDSMTKAWHATGNAAFEAMATANKQLKEQAPLVKTTTDAINGKTVADREALKQERERVRLLKEAEKAQRDFLRPFEQSARTAQDRLKQLKNEAEAMALAEREQISLTRAIELTTIARLEEQKAMVGNDVAAQLIADEITARRQIIAMLESKELIDAAQQVRDRERSAWQRHHDEISQFAIQAYRNIQSALADGLFRFFDDGFKGMVKGVVSAVGRIASEFMSLRLLQGLGFGGSAFASGGGMGIMDLASMGSSALNLVKGGFGFNSLVGGGLSAVGGSGLLGSFGAGLAGGSEAAAFIAAESAVAGAGTAASFGASVGAAAGPLAIAYAGTQILKSIAGDKRMGGGFGNALNTIGDIPILGDFIPVVPLMNSLFGRGPLKQKETNLIGDITAGGFEGITSTKFKAKGGAVRSSKVDRVMLDTDTGELLNRYRGLVEGGISGVLQPFAEQAKGYALELGRFLDDSISGISASLRSVAGNLGIGTEALDNFAMSIDIASEKGKALTEEQIAQVIADAGEAMARELIPGIDALSRSGESALQTVNRLSMEFSALENAAAVLSGSTQAANQSVLALSFNQRSAMVEAAGGIDALNQKIGFFAENFLTAEEKFNLGYARLNEQLVKLDFSADMSKEDFAELIKSVTQAGGISVETASALLDLAPAFITVKNAEAELAATTDALASSERDLNTIRQELLASYQKERSELEASVSKFQMIADRLRDFRDSLALGELSPLTPGQKLEEARNQFNRTRLLISQGDQAALESLPGTAESFLRASQVYNASSAAYISDFNLVQSVLDSAATSAISQAQLAREQLAALKSSVEALTGIEDAAKTTNELLRELITATLSGIGNEAITSQMIVDFLQANPQLSTQDIINTAVRHGVSGSQVADALGVDQSVINLATGGQSVSDQMIRDFVNANINDPMAIYNAAIANGISSQRLSDVTGIPLGDINRFVEDNNLAQLDRGTDFVPKTGLALLHRGEAVTPAGSFDEIKALRDEVAQLRREQAQQMAELVNVTAITNKQNADAIIAANKDMASTAVWRERSAAVLR